MPTGTDGAVIVASDYANTRMPPGLIVDTSEGVFEFQEGRNNYTGTVDTANTGTTANCSTWTGSAFEWDGGCHRTELGFLRFDDIVGDGPGQIPPGATVNSARLVLDVIDGGDTGEL